MQGGYTHVGMCPNCGKNTLTVVEFVHDGISGTDLYDKLYLPQQGKFFCTNKKCGLEGGGISSREIVTDYLKWTQNYLIERYHLKPFGPEGSKKAR